jgi:hypothetical protein
VHVYGKKENAFTTKENAFTAKENTFTAKENAFAAKENAFLRQMTRDNWQNLCINDSLSRRERGIPNA